MLTSTRNSTSTTNLETLTAVYEQMAQAKEKTPTTSETSVKPITRKSGPSASERFRQFGLLALLASGSALAGLTGAAPQLGRAGIKRGNHFDSLESPAIPAAQSDAHLTCRLPIKPAFSSKTDQGAVCQAKSAVVFTQPTKFYITKAFGLDFPSSDQAVLINQISSQSPTLLKLFKKAKQQNLKIEWHAERSGYARKQSIIKAEEKYRFDPKNWVNTDRSTQLKIASEMVMMLAHELGHAFDEELMPPNPDAYKNEQDYVEHGFLKFMARHEGKAVYQQLAVADEIHRHSGLGAKLSRDKEIYYGEDNSMTNIFSDQTLKKKEKIDQIGDYVASIHPAFFKQSENQVEGKYRTFAKRINRDFRT